MFLKHSILANYVGLAHVPNPSIPVSGFLERRGCFYTPGIFGFFTQRLYKINLLIVGAGLPAIIRLIARNQTHVSINL